MGAKKEPKLVFCRGWDKQQRARCSKPCKTGLCDRCKSVEDLGAARERVIQVAKKEAAHKEGSSEMSTAVAELIAAEKMFLKWG